MVVPVDTAAAVTVLTASPSPPVAAERVAFSAGYRAATSVRCTCRSAGAPAGRTSRARPPVEPGGFKIVATMATGKRTFRAFVLRTSRSSWVVTPTLTLSSAAQSASLQFGPAAVGQSKAGRANLTPVLARFSPARPAREVVLQRYASGRWSTVTTSRQDRTGKATFLALPGGDTRSYRDWVRLAAALTAAPEGTARTDAALGLISIATDLDDRSPQSSPGRSSGPRSPYPAMVSAADAHPHGGKIRS